MSNEKTKPNRNKCVQWEITFPHSGDICDSKFHEYFPPSVYSICAKEQHANEEPHLHLGLKLKKPISKTNLLNYIEKKFPEDFKRINISQIQNWQNWDDYCAKEVVPFIRGSRTKTKTPVEKVAKLLEKHPELWAALGNVSAQEVLEEAEEMAERRRVLDKEMAERRRKYDERALTFQMNRLTAM